LISYQAIVGAVNVYSQIHNTIDARWNLADGHREELSSDAKKRYVLLLYLFCIAYVLLPFRFSSFLDCGGFL
jgi:hypothetical protein